MSHSDKGLRGFSITCAVRSILAISSAVFFLVWGAGGGQPRDAPSDPFGRYRAALEQAETLQLSHHPVWRSLLHWSSPGKGGRSAITDRSFFLSNRGMHDADAELNALLGALLIGPPQRRDSCCARFPARVMWVTERLDLPPVSCNVAPTPDILGDPRSFDRVALVFAAGYMNSAPSMAGHVFLAFSGKNHTGAGRMCVQFAGGQAADTLTCGDVCAALWGVLEGYYSASSYSDQTRNYRHLEHRDLWEYDLDLERREVVRLAAHAIELRGIRVPFSFFGNNCAKRLVRLLEVARPMAGIGRHLPWIVTPIDVVKAVDRAGLVRAIRCSRATRNEYDRRFRALRATDRSLVLQLSGDGSSLDLETVRGLPVERAIPVLEAAILRLRLLFLHGRVPVVEYRARLDRITSLAADPGSLFEPETGIPSGAPHTAHSPVRVAVGVRSHDGAAEGVVRLRGGMHGLLENPAGYSPWSEVVVLDASARFGICGDPAEVDLDSLTVVRFQSLVPANGYRVEPSWRTAIGLKRNPLDADNGRPAWYAHFGLGIAAEYGRNSLGYVMADLGGQCLDGARGLRAQTSCEIGYILSTRRLSIRVWGRAMMDHAVEGDYVLSWNLDARIPLGKRSAVCLEYVSEHGGESRRTSCTGLISFFW